MLDLVLLDETNPQSLAFQLARASELVATFPIDAALAKPTEDRRILMDLLTRVRLLDVDAIFDGDTIDPHGVLFDLLSKLNNALPVLSDVIGRTYLAHVRGPLGRGWVP